MKNILLIFVYLCLHNVAYAQSSYKEAIEKGNKAFENGQFRKAKDFYFAAEAFDPSKKEEVRKKVNQVFEKIEKLKEEAETAKKQAKTALAETEKQKQLATQNLAKANKLVNAFYFCLR